MISNLIIQKRKYFTPKEKILKFVTWFDKIYINSKYIVKLDIGLSDHVNDWGFCKLNFKNKNTFGFTIRLNSMLVNNEKELYITLAHEMWHLIQYVKGDLFDDDTYTIWKKEYFNVDEMKSNEMPWEKEAYSKEKIIYSEWIKYKLENL